MHCIVRSDMLVYRTVMTRIVVGLCVSYSMTVYSMEGDPEHLINSEGSRSRTSSLLLGVSLPSSCPRSLCGNTSAIIKMPVPTRASSVATVSSRYSKKKMAAIGSLVLAAGFAGYYIGSTCQMCVHELKAAQVYVDELDSAFRACQNSTTYLVSLLDTCVESLDSVKDIIIEVCTRNGSTHQK